MSAIWEIRCPRFSQRKFEFREMDPVANISTTHNTHSVFHRRTPNRHPYASNRYQPDLIFSSTSWLWYLFKLPSPQQQHIHIRLQQACKWLTSVACCLALTDRGVRWEFIMFVHIPAATRCIRTSSAAGIVGISTSYVRYIDTWEKSSSSDNSRMWFFSSLLLPRVPCAGDG